MMGVCLAFKQAAASLQPCASVAKSDFYGSKLPSSWKTRPRFKWCLKGAHCASTWCPTCHVVEGVRAVPSRTIISVQEGLMMRP